MSGIHDMLKIHKRSSLFSKRGTAVDCVLKSYPSHEGYGVSGLTSFIGLTIEESGYGCYADSFELTLNADEVFEYTNQVPARGWIVTVRLPQMNDKIVPFYIEEVATDRTLGMYLLKCSTSTTPGNGKRIDRNNGDDNSATPTLPHGGM